MARRFGLLTTASLFVALGAALLPAAARAQVPGGPTGTTVQVQYLTCPPAPKDGDGQAPPCYRASAPGVPVQAVAAGDGEAAPVAVSTTDGLGATTLTLAPGSYWLFVPEPDQDTGTTLDDVQPVEMPDGTEVLGWTAVEIGTDSRASTTSVTVTLQIAP
jgi:hypothetical protein